LSVSDPLADDPQYRLWRLSIDGGNDSHALNATTAILRHTLNAVEVLDLGERPAAVEATFAEKKKP
jgi:hypothetical protein